MDWSVIATAFLAVCFILTNYCQRKIIVRQKADIDDLLKKLNDATFANGNYQEFKDWATPILKASGHIYGKENYLEKNPDSKRENA